MLGLGLPAAAIGLDICRIPRIKKNLTSPMAARFVRRILTPQEIEMPHTWRYIGYLFSPSEKPKSTSAEKAAEFMAGRFAAKEAVIKAYHLRKLSFHDIVVTYQGYLPTASDKETPSDSPEAGDDSTAQGSGGPPVAIIQSDEAHEKAYARLSISHDGEYAAAVCLTTP
ncbi:hypothetical protein GGR52DRAFT_562140 [Hypoxylon sp. FL1284]|nr:hypothetical protein GGR52DRAFT_562140 [Hypoxylon sp. FL1284]